MDNELYLCSIDPGYLKFLHNIDYRVSVKYHNRPFVGVVTMINGIPYVIPLTSKTTKIRQQEGKKKRPSAITTFVRNSSKEEIADLLHNNMIPVFDDVYTVLTIDAEQDTYEANEIRFIRKNKERIITKSQNVYNKRVADKPYYFKRYCCDFGLLEQHYKEYKK